MSCPAGSIGRSGRPRLIPLWRVLMISLSSPAVGAAPRCVGFAGPRRGAKQVSVDHRLRLCDEHTEPFGGGLVGEVGALGG
jgi:hypothetical protein